MGARVSRGATALAAVVLAGLTAVGCELQEVTVVDVEDVIIVEAYALVGVDTPDPTVGRRLWAFVSRTVDGDQGSDVPAAEVEVVRSDGRRFVLVPVDVRNCISDAERARPGVCYDAGARASGLRPGDELDLTVRLADGRTLEGRTTIPGDFRLEQEASPCGVLPNTPFEVRWSPAEGASAYVNETRIDGLDQALADEGIPAPGELFLLGVSLSASDTTIVFPSEFGVFDRFDLDQALSVRLQRGLPDDTQAFVGITATDRNYVNWARGGNFNPSGQVRVPSVHGDGSGVFASGVMRRFGVFAGSSPQTDALPRCSGGS